MAKGDIKGSSKKGYTINDKKVTNKYAIEYAKNDSNYEVYSQKNSKSKIIRSKPDNSKEDNVNTKKKK